MLILVPWKPVVFVWCLLTAVILMGYAVYCLEEGRNPFSIEKYQMKHPPTRQTVGDRVRQQKHSKHANRGTRHNPGSSNASYSQRRSDQ
jgi:hypothetical protein